jgi:hypothetical protein
MNVPAKASQSPDIMESVLLTGDLAKMTADGRVQYYNAVCKSMGLNPLTQPFSYITLNGKLQLYARRDCADQLRKINGVTLTIVSRQIADDILTVHVRATLPDGRSDEDFGSVAMPATLKGEARANAELKAVTKAKRRATLSICGLGWLDETEVDDIPAGAKRPAIQHLSPPPNPPTRENSPAAQASDEAAPATPPPAETPAGAASNSKMGIEDMAREAAYRGRDMMNTFFRSRSREEQTAINRIRPELDQILKDLEDADSNNS